MVDTFLLSLVRSSSTETSALPKCNKCFLNILYALFGARYAGLCALYIFLYTGIVILGAGCVQESMHSKCIVARFRRPI